MIRKVKEQMRQVTKGNEMKYIAKFSKRGEGVIEVEYESAEKAGTRGNKTDARCAMLKIYGNDAISWQLLKVRRV